MDIKLFGKKAIVCGASKGIGYAIAKQFAELGADVLITSRNEENLKKSFEALTNSGSQKHGYIAADFSDPKNAFAKLQEYIQDNSPIHILVNNSGGPAPGQVIEADPEDFLKGFNSHLIMSQMLTKAVVSGMKSENYGRIINVISISVKQPVENLGVSNTIRGAMNSWSKTLSRELGQYGITVNNLLPGHTSTERLASLNKANAEKKGITSEEFASNIMKNIPVGRFAKPEELGYAAAFLASEYAGFINGINLPVDGGFIRGF